VKKQKRMEVEVEFPSVLKASSGEGRHRADAVGIVTKEGVVAGVFGGERSHFGAVAFAYPTKALHSENIWLNLNVVSVPGHADFEETKSMAEKFAKELQQCVTAIWAVHLEPPYTEDDMNKARSNANQASDKLLEDVKKRFSTRFGHRWTYPINPKEQY